MRFGGVSRCRKSYGTVRCMFGFGVGTPLTGGNTRFALAVVKRSTLLAFVN